jgi:hypothetical protein
MQHAITFIEQTSKFIDLLAATRVEGRKYDRYDVGGKVKYFVDRTTWVIYGAKSHFQHNPRREYGTLLTINQYQWPDGIPIGGTDAENVHRAREASIKIHYKKRGRPRKLPVGPVVTQ